MIRVYADIVGDLFHVGHINLFKQAKELGDYLIVGVHSDNSVESYKRKPIFSEQDRYEIVRNCSIVDEVIEDAPLVLTRKYIDDNKIDVVVHGDDISPHFEVQHKVPLEMGIMKYMKYTDGVSTSEIINRIKND
jgi:cytidyltransferase-like protein|tara:strand:+ start:1074 stop:1475 length:402 start_codon:yes stop_codon:yes gene_type:complete